MNETFFKVEKACNFSKENMDCIASKLKKLNDSNS